MMKASWRYEIYFAIVEALNDDFLTDLNVLEIFVGFVRHEMPEARTFTNSLISESESRLYRMILSLRYTFFI
jgi:hypothetical protein